MIWIFFRLEVVKRDAVERIESETPEERTERQQLSFQEMRKDKMPTKSRDFKAKCCRKKKDREGL